MRAQRLVRGDEERSFDEAPLGRPAARRACLVELGANTRGPFVALRQPVAALGPTQLQVRRSDPCSLSGSAALHSTRIGLAPAKATRQVM